MAKELGMLEHGPIGIIALEGCKAHGEMVNAHLCNLRGEDPNEHNYLIDIEQTRFSNGEAKIKIKESVRGKDIYILADVGNYSCTYKMFNYENHMSPDEHMQDIKRALSAIGGKANRITVVMPLLYASRQHRRKGRESLDCAMALQELEQLGVSTIITFDAHDPNIQNAIPNVSFENIYPTYNILKALLKKEGNVFNKDNLIVISPDTGAMDRAIYYANVLELDVGMFYKRRDHSRIVNGKNPIVQHEYIGRDLDGMNAIIVDDMIASGESVLDIIEQLQSRNVGKIFVASTFGFFTAGVEKFRKYYDEGKLSAVYCTNGSYIPQAVLDEPWFECADISKFVAKLMSALNHDESISPLLNASHRIRKLIENDKKSK